jgi:hypothetical protein
MAQFHGCEGSCADNEVFALDAIPLVVGEDPNGNVFAWVGLRPLWVSDDKSGTVVEEVWRWRTCPA